MFLSPLKQKSLLTFIFLVKCFLVYSTTQDHKSLADFITDENGLLYITDENYDSFLKLSNMSLLFSFRHPCKLCRQIFPQLEKTIHPLKSLSSPVYFGRLNMTENPMVTEKLNLTDIISMKFFSERIPMDYNGGRSGEEIVSWVRARFDPIIGDIKSVNEVEQLQKLTEILVLFFGDNLEKFSEYFRAAKGREQIIFTKCNLQECFDKYHRQSGDIIIFKKFDKNPGILTSEMYNNRNLNSLLDEQMRPSVMKFNINTAKFIFHKNNPGLFLYRSKSEAKKYDHILQDLYDSLKNEIKLVVTDVIEGPEIKLANILDIKQTKFPLIVIHDTRNTLRSYVLDKELNRENIISFVNNWKNGKLTPFIKSKAIPEKQNEPCFVLVGKTLEQQVMDSTKDVVVMFYAPWDKHSKNLYPLYEEIAKDFKNQKDLLIAKFDAHSNDVHLVDVEFYPTVIMWPANDKSRPVVFKGDYMDKNLLVRFIRDYSFNKIPEENKNESGEKDISESSVEEISLMENDFKENKNNSNSEF